MNRFSAAVGRSGRVGRSERAGRKSCPAAGTLRRVLGACLAVLALFSPDAPHRRLAAQDAVPNASAPDTATPAADAKSPADVKAPAGATAPAGAKAPADAVQKEPALDLQQQALLGRFDRLDQEMLQMAEQLRRVDPERSDLLDRARSRSQQERIVGQMQVLLDGLGRNDRVYGDLIQREEALLASMSALLDLLQSENRIGEIEAERQRIQGILKNVNKLIGQEKDARALTERSGDAEQAAGKQEQVEKDAGKLVEGIDKQDAEKRAAEEGHKQPDGGDQKPKADPSGDAKPEAGTPNKGEKPEPGESPDSKAKPGEAPNGDSKSKPGDQEQSGESPNSEKPQSEPQPGESPQAQPQNGSPQQGQSGQPQTQQQQQTPGREDLEQARQEMQRAIDELRKKQDPDKASKHQDEAIRQLLEAKEKLEEILRQLREEEKSLTLASLESRFRKMLGLQLLVYQDTVQLGAKGKEAEPNLEPRSRQLARQEEEIVQEIDKALILLHEEGSSVAFPEAVEAIREDMLSVVGFLDRAAVGELTQTVEQSVIETLEEMIDAMQKEMQKQEEEQRQQQGDQQQGSEEDDPLVDAIAELKMLRSLQLRINRRTKQLGKMLEEAATPDPNVVQQIRSLSQRQSKVQAATYDLSTGKNQ